MRILLIALEIFMSLDRVEKQIQYEKGCSWQE